LASLYVVLIWETYSSFDYILVAFVDLFSTFVYITQFSLRYVNYAVVYFSKSAWFTGGFYSTNNQLRWETDIDVQYESEMTEFWNTLPTNSGSRIYNRVAYTFSTYDVIAF